MAEGEVSASRVFEVIEDYEKEDIMNIAEKLLQGLKTKLKDMKIEVEFSSSAIEKIADAGFDDIYGARPLKRAIQSLIEDEISEKILSGEIKKGENVLLEYNDSKFIFTKQ